MVNDNEFDELANRELLTMDIALSASVGRSAITIDEYIKMQLSQGISREVILEGLLADLEVGGRIFGEFNRAIKSTATGSLNRSRDIGSYSETGVIERYRWVAVFVNTCPDCMDRHGIVLSWEKWEARGMPRTNQTICKQNCKCMLVPADSTKEIEPIQRGKK